MAILQRLTYKREYANINIFVQFLHVYLSGGARWTEGQYIRSQPLFHRSLILRNMFNLECVFARYLPRCNATLCSEINFQEHFELGPNIPDGVSRPPTCNFINY